jgi:Sugar-transfer associated ATP-grasp
LPIDVALRKMAQVAKSSPLKVMREYAALAFGPGQLSFSDYTKLRLFDDAFYANSDKRTVVGQRRNFDIDLTINYRHDWMGLFSNKVASASYLAAHGFPTIPAAAIYAKDLVGTSHLVARNRDDLRAFLVNEANYPLFGKPIEGVQSLGSIGLKRYLPGADSLETMDGREIPLDHFMLDIDEHYAHGYLFQNFLTPHPAIYAVCGDRPATVRIVTVAFEGEPKVFRACWKIPTGSNIADNYWRPGNLLAQIDMTNGRVLRVTSGIGLDLIEHTHHPDTKSQLVGMEIPGWTRLSQTAVEAARLMRHMPLIGWDMAMLETKPVIVEMNEKPDLFLNQLADGRGILDEELTAFLKSQKKKAADRVRSIKRDVHQL